MSNGERSHNFSPHDTSAATFARGLLKRSSDRFRQGQLSTWLSLPCDISGCGIEVINPQVTLLFSK